MAGRVLIVDGAADSRILLRAMLTEAQYQPVMAPHAGEALQVASQAAPDAIVLDMGSLRDAAGVLRGLRRTCPEVPVLALGDRPAGRIAALRAGADAVLDKAAPGVLILSRLRSLARMRGPDLGLQPGAPGLAEAPAPFQSAPHPPMPCRIAVFGTGAARDLVEHALALSPERGAIVVAQGDRCLPPGADHDTMPDLHLVAQPPQADAATGARTIADIRARARGLPVACILLRAAAGAAADALAFDLGADDVIDPAADAVETGLRIAALLRRKRMADRLHAALRDNLRLAVTDALTGLHNRHHALHRLAAMRAAAREAGGALTVVLADIDRFKLVNDRWGHGVGDMVLVAVAARMRQVLGEGDLLVRFGGEEFLMALPGLDLPAARAVADRVARAVRSLTVTLDTGEEVRVTLSLGLAALGCGYRDTGVQDLIDQADRALMAAKTAGRGRVMVCLDAA